MKLLIKYKILKKKKESQTDVSWGKTIEVYVSKEKDLKQCVLKK